MDESDVRKILSELAVLKEKADQQAASQKQMSEGLLARDSVADARFDRINEKLDDYKNDMNLAVQSMRMEMQAATTANSREIRNVYERTNEAHTMATRHDKIIGYVAKTVGGVILTALVYAASSGIAAG